MADSIYVAGLELRARLGVTGEERAQLQRITAYLSLTPERSFTALEDSVQNTVDYAAVCKAIHEIVEERPRNLLETAAGDVASGILRQFPACAAVDIELRKYALSDTAYVAVRLTRAQPANP